jgi:lipopolysaccharide transport system ATP-binding protein
VTAAIRVQGLGKVYRIGAAQPRTHSLREALTRAAVAPIRRLVRGERAPDPGPEAIAWALRDVSFDVKHGELLGIIGRNGAGKSTLLKVLSRIVDPSEGRVELHGRVGSLLEVGTGFHPELTGRDNVYLNGSILGMDRRHIERRFDEIVEFAGVERFIDTPVKRYSSGMYLRLAFSVAAHLEPDILIMDEVLAVGDASFQKKCLGKMEDVAHEGRTVLFVSHDMAAVARLCNRTLLLDGGRVLADGPTARVISTYLHSGLRSSAERRWSDPATAPGDDIVRLVSARVFGEDGESVEALDIRGEIGVEMEYEVLKSGSVLVPNFHFYNDQGVCAFVALDADPAWRRRPRPAGRYTSTVWIPGNLLAEGSLTVHVAISTMDPVIVHALELDALAFQMVDSLDGDSARGDYAGPIPGVVRPLLRWTTASGERGERRAPAPKVAAEVGR